MTSAPSARRTKNTVRSRRRRAAAGGLSTARGSACRPAARVRTVNRRRVSVAPVRRARRGSSSPTEARAARPLTSTTYRSSPRRASMSMPRSRPQATVTVNPCASRCSFTAAFTSSSDTRTGSAADAVGDTDAGAKTAPCAASPQAWSRLTSLPSGLGTAKHAARLQTTARLVTCGRTTQSSAANRSAAHDLPRAHGARAGTSSPLADDQGGAEQSHPDGGAQPDPLAARPLGREPVGCRPCGGPGSVKRCRRARCAPRHLPAVCRKRAPTVREDRCSQPTQPPAATAKSS